MEKSCIIIFPKKYKKIIKNKNDILPKIHLISSKI